MQMAEGSEIVQCIQKYRTIQNLYVTHQNKLRDQKKTKQTPKNQKKKKNHENIICNIDM